MISLADVPAPTVDDVVGTCDWGHCDRDAYAVRWDSDTGRWLTVCSRHRAGRNVLAVRLDDVAGWDAL